MLSSNEILKKTQKGLLFATPDHGCFVNVRYDDPSKVLELKDDVIRKCRELLDYANKFDVCHPEARTRITVGFNPAHWKMWFPEIKDLEQRPEKYLIDTSTKFLETGGDVFFFIKSEDKSNVDEIAHLLLEKLKDLKQHADVSFSSPSGKRILQRNFRDGLVNAADAETLRSYTIIPDNMTTGKPGSSYMMTQKFELDWLVLGNMWNSEKEDMIGRRVMTDSFIPSVNKRAHTFRAHFNPEKSPQNMLNKHRIMFRQSLPYGISATGKGREEGIFYLSFANTTNSFRDVLESLVGNDDVAGAGEVTVDLLLNTIKPLEGTWWYVPSAEELGVSISSSGNFEVNEYWNISNPSNPYLFYNEKEYLYRMTSGGYVDLSEVPTSRVLRLLGYAFRQWNDQWFRERDVPPIKHLENYLKPQRVEKVMNQSVLIRKAKSIKICLSKVFTSNRVKDMDDSEFYGNKADLFNIHPDEMIVGRMPNFGLGIGKVAMPYLKEGNEKMDAFMKGLSETSATGHVIPNIDTILQKGVSGYIMELVDKKGSGKKLVYLI
jgi:Dyp-type peroxidase family